MKFNKLFRLMRMPAALILAIFMLFSVVGCSAEDISDGLALAGDIIELIDEIEIDGSGTEAQTEPSESDEAVTLPPEADVGTDAAIDEDGYYYSRDDVALYLHTYGKLPDNFITKSEAEKLGWQGGSVERYRDGAAIGGDKFGNREGLLPKKSGRVYYECDIDTNGRSERGAKRIVFSNDGLIYYTDDHYESFTLLFGEE